MSIRLKMQPQEYSQGFSMLCTSDHLLKADVTQFQSCRS